MFSSLKRSRLLADCQHLGIAKTRLHVSLSMIAYAATMMVHVLEGDYQGMRNMAMHQLFADPADQPLPLVA